LPTAPTVSSKYLKAAFTLLVTAFDEIVALDTAFISLSADAVLVTRNFPDFPANCPVKLSFDAFWPSPGVSLFVITLTPAIFESEMATIIPTAPA